jgi:hypothetical protein
MTAWMKAAKAQAKKYERFNEKKFDSVIVYTPRIYDQNHIYDACRFDGAAMYGGNAVFLNGKRETGLVVHELGHNMRLSHAGRYTCGSVDPNCLAPYGDSYDPMGCGLTSCSLDFNAFHKYRLRWFRSNQVVSLTSGQKAFTLSASEDPRTGLKMILIPRDSQSWYAVEYRAPIALDKKAKSVKGVWVHIVKYASGSLDGHDIGGDDTELLSPGPLLKYDSFSDRARNIWVNVAGIDGRYARVNIQVGDIAPPSTSPTVPPTEPPSTTPTSVVIDPTPSTDPPPTDPPPTDPPTTGDTVPNA